LYGVQPTGGKYRKFQMRRVDAIVAIIAFQKERKRLEA
jgi:hypothetical protein